MTARSTDRASNGRFLKGHTGGPGRPRRAVEQEYLAKLNATVTLEVWQQIVERAVQDAKNGDAKAREWIAKYLIGDERPSLVLLAANERAGITADVAIDSLACKQQVSAMLANFQQALGTCLSLSVDAGESDREGDWPQ